MDFTAAELARLGALLAMRAGIEFPESRWPFLRSRAQALMMQEGHTDAAAWTATLERTAGEPDGPYRALEAAVLVHESSFGRYPAHWRLLADVLAQPGARQPVRVWSVGCSTGQEPYGLAMAALAQCGAAAPARVEIVAVDVAPRVLEIAGRGAYPAAAVEALPAEWVARYLRAAGTDVVVSPDVRRLVRFVHYDLRDGLYLGKFDLVVCCNLLLYFTPAWKATLLQRLADALHPGGWLVLGHADGVTPPSDLFASRSSDDAFVYRRH